jgi:hypothetical protein
MMTQIAFGILIAVPLYITESRELMAPVMMSVYVLQCLPTDGTRAARINDDISPRPAGQLTHKITLISAAPERVGMAAIGPTPKRRRRPGGSAY